MRILLYGINFSPELTGIGKYSGELIEWLASKNHESCVITAPPYYPTWKVGEGFSSFYFKKEKQQKISVYRCPLWVPKHPNAIKRLIHLLSFTISSFPVLISLITWKPDVIICIAPSFFYAPQTILFSRLTHSKTWLHFQDFEICAMFGTGMMTSLKRLNNFAHSIQSFITRKFDIVSTISHTMVKSAEKRMVSRSAVRLLPNWVDLDFIRPDGNKHIFKNRWGIKKDQKIILYSGNIGKKQGLETLVKAADLLKQKKNILFIVVGDGAFKQALKQLALAKKLTNILFKPLQPYELLPDLLCCADIHLVLQKKGTKDSFLPSKLTSILSSGGNAIITAEKGSELYHIVKSNPGIGVNIPPETPQCLADTIISMLNEKKKSAYNYTARKYAEAELGKEAVLSRFENQLKELVKAGEH